MFLVILEWLFKFLLGVFFLKVVFVMVAVQASLAYNKIIGRDIQAKYQQVNMIPDLVKIVADNNIYQRYSIDPPRFVAYPAFYRKGFKFFNEEIYKYAIFYDGTGKYTVYRKVRPEISNNKTKSFVKGKSKIRYE